MRYRKQSGVSLLIGLGLVGVIFLFSLIVQNVVLTSIRQSANVNRANEAYFAAEGGLEKGLLINSNEDPGYSSADELFVYGGEDCQDVNGDPLPGCANVDFSVTGEVPEDTAYGMGSQYEGSYGIPVPGTGDVGEDCDPLTAFKDEKFDYGTMTNFKYVEASAGQFDPADHPCNWNRIQVGETVTIPLYVNDPGNVNCQADGFCNPADMAMTQSEYGIMVRLRVPCEDSMHEFCDPMMRKELDDEFGDEDWKCGSTAIYGCGDTIVSWSISGNSLDGEENYEFRPLGVPEWWNPGGRSNFNSEIYEYLINNADTGNYGTGYEMLDCGQHCVFNEQRGGMDIAQIQITNPDTAINFLFNTNEHARTCGNPPTDYDTIHKPVLRLSVINTLRDKFTQGSTIPYLEYQLISTLPSGYQPTAEAQTIRAEGYSGEFRQILEVKQPQEGGLLEYVIQQ